MKGAWSLAVALVLAVALLHLPTDARADRWVEVTERLVTVNPSDQMNAAYCPDAPGAGCSEKKTKMSHQTVWWINRVKLAVCPVRAESLWTRISRMSTAVHV